MTTPHHKWCSVLTWCRRKSRNLWSKSQLANLHWLLSDIRRTPPKSTAVLYVIFNLSNNSGSLLLCSICEECIGSRMRHSSLKTATTFWAYFFSVVSPRFQWASSRTGCVAVLARCAHTTRTVLRYSRDQRLCGCASGCAGVEGYRRRVSYGRVFSLPPDPAWKSKDNPKILCHISS